MPIFAGNAARQRTRTTVAAAALLHVLADLPPQASDAPARFKSLRAARIQSPLSFRDRGHQGRVVDLAEAGLLAVCFGVMWARLDWSWQRWLAAGLALVNAAVFVHP